MRPLPAEHHSLVERKQVGNHARDQRRDREERAREVARVLDRKVRGRVNAVIVTGREVDDHVEELGLLRLARRRRLGRGLVWRGEGKVSGEKETSIDTTGGT